DLVERQAGMESPEPERLVRADQVHVVAAVGERLAEFGRQDAAAAHRRVTNNSNIHVLPGGFVPRNPLTPSLAGAPCPAPLRRLTRCARSRSRTPDRERVSA